MRTLYASSILFLALAACSHDIPLGLPEDDSHIEVDTDQNLKDKVDVLFVIDDSGSMFPKQEALKQRFPDLIKQLDDFAASGNKASYHIGVITTDLGAPGISCGKNRGGKLQQLGADAAPGCQGPVGKNYIEYDQKAGTTNLPAGQDLPTTFGCMASVGDKGCGFEMPLEAAYRALHDPIAENAGFLRADAILVVVFFTDEDDCSADPTSDLFTSNPAYGPLNSYRCVRYGVVCDGQLLPETPQASFASCRPATSAEGGKLTDLQKYINFFTQPSFNGGVKAYAKDVVLSSISAPSAPFGTESVSATEMCGQGTTSCTLVQHSCVSPQDTTFSGDPAVRLEAVLGKVRHRNMASICDTDYKSALEGVGGLINAALLPSCVPRPLPDPVRPNCEVEDRTNDPSGGVAFLRTPMPSCASTTARPCWTLKQVDTCEKVCNPLDGRTQQVGITIDRGGQMAPPYTSVHVSCEVVPSETRGLACN